MNLHELVRDYGLLAVFLTALLEQFGLPFPALPILLIAGASSAVDPWFGVLAMTLASAVSFAGGIALFVGGQKHGDLVLRFLCRVSFAPHKCIRIGLTAFDRFGPKTLIFSRFIPGLHHDYTT